MTVKMFEHYALDGTLGRGAFATVYRDDLYVDPKQSLVSAEAIRAMAVHVSDEHEHDGLTSSGTDVIDHLLGMARDAR